MVAFNRRRLAIVHEEPIVTNESKQEGMGMTFINGTAGSEADMADDNPAFHHPGQPLEAVMYTAGNIGAFGRFFREGTVLLKIAYAPAIHVLAGLFGKEG
jgi:hypothetical protein